MGTPITYADASGGLRISLHEPDARLDRIPEAVLQDLWRRLDFDLTGLQTTAGAPVQILDPGQLNLDGGPDFSAARVRIGEVEWVGDVEIHRTSGEWVVHRHDEDRRYDRVVLHVTLGTDRHTGALRRADGTAVPEVVLLPRLQSSLRALLYEFFAQPSAAFPCAPSWRKVPRRIKGPWLRLLAQERLRDRMAPLAGGTPPAETLEDVLYRATMRALGYAPNADAMEQLARRIPLRRLRQCRDRMDAEALLLGAAGLLPTAAALPPGDEATQAYALELIERFRSQPEATAPPMRSDAWQFARLRPANSPARRIAQAAVLLSTGGLLDDDPLAAFRDALHRRRPITAMRQLLLHTEAHPFWRTHIRPETRCRDSPAALGQARADTIIANAVIPTLLLAAERERDYQVADRALDVLLDLPAPDDRVTRLFAAHGPAATNALEAQGLHHLLKTRCEKGRCLSCTVGRWLLER